MWSLSVQAYWDGCCVLYNTLEDLLEGMPCLEEHNYDTSIKIKHWDFPENFLQLQKLIEYVEQRNWHKN